MNEPDLPVAIEVHDVSEWLSTDLPAWATRTRFHARLVERDGVVVLIARLDLPNSPLGVAAA